MKSITTVVASKDFERDQLWLNGEEEKFANRHATCIRELRKLARDRVDENGNVVVRADEWSEYKLRISSINTFPTAAGLASSAAGYACLVATLAKLYNVKEEYPGQLSSIARQGSGSACRSLYGGFVEWQKGNKPDGSDSMAIQVADENHWPELRALIMVVSDRKKDTSSTGGMKNSKDTSELLHFRASNVVDKRMDVIKKAYIARDFNTFGRITMQDSNQFHATCLDTYPPIFYMNDVSKDIVRLLTAYNNYYKEVKAAYTFDAGPNAVIYCLDKDLEEIAALMLHYFPSASSTTPYVNDATLEATARERYARLPSDLIQALEATGRVPTANDVKYVYKTKSGPGPLSFTQYHLVDLNTGRPTMPPELQIRRETSKHDNTSDATTTNAVPVTSSVVDCDSHCVTKKSGKCSVNCWLTHLGVAALSAGIAWAVFNRLQKRA